MHMQTDIDIDSTSTLAHGSTLVISSHSLLGLRAAFYGPVVPLCLGFRRPQLQALLLSYYDVGHSSKPLVLQGTLKEALFNISGRLKV
jgi:hypothetical protein